MFSREQLKWAASLTEMTLFVDIQLGPKAQRVAKVTAELNRSAIVS
jgi:hypothetical protein